MTIAGKRRGDHGISVKAARGSGGAITACWMWWYGVRVGCADLRGASTRRCALLNAAVPCLSLALR
eukprot:CAMPEP_0181330604 /NCGR_PEP_ID=MMETSP1101-20121128/23994_1 /TAXON_ID=46948 /ORGANISM="Rhodomonas abbreviata, Strain Caron Lab Isolate" /LENGTH=65 /DNA_ID=CAMNT_0023439883 /DNA_START=221 /DNA_END=414 /DNA_ORIENTATION=+